MPTSAKPPDIASASVPDTLAALHELVQEGTVRHIGSSNFSAAQLEDAGVKQVNEIGICTKEHYLFPSHRRHPDGKRFGAIVAVR